MTDDRKLRDAKGISMPALERAALAICALPTPANPHGRPCQTACGGCLAEAQAALLSLRVPDEAMLEAWRAHLAASVGMPEPVARSAVKMIVANWQRGIDSILAEQPATGERG